MIQLFYNNRLFVYDTSKGGKGMFNNNRPRFKLVLSPFEKIFNVIGYGLFGLALIYLLISYFNMPEQIPTHVNGFGEVDETGSKYMALVIPLVVVPLIAMLQFLENNPHLHNFPPHFNENNAERMYKHSKQLFNVTKNLVLILFAHIMYRFTVLALGGESELYEIVVLIIMSLMFTTIIFKLVQMHKTK